jgi:hypothetical protein
VLDLTLATMQSAGGTGQRFPGMKMSGPKPAWSTESGGPLAMTMQRLSN